jgi:tRNA 2-selenouridine synthase
MRPLADSQARTARTRAVPVTRVEPLLEHEDALVIDLRSPGEFAEDHLPGARNVPLFGDEERALIGFLYHRESPQVAFEQGRALASARIQRLVSEIAGHAGWRLTADDLDRRVMAMTEAGIDGLTAELAGEPVSELPARPVLLHCWRGGLRSLSVVAFLRSLGYDDAMGLIGGYKAYRRHVIDATAGWDAPPAYVLRGLTGVGKTLVLREIEAQRPGSTFDLERLAGHRSSLLGMVGLEPCTQKTFESRILARIREGSAGPLVFEGESRKVGDAIIPEHVWGVLGGGTSIELRASRAHRVQVLLDDYLATDASRPALRCQLEAVAERMPGRPDLVSMLDGGREAALVELLLEDYYDPLYRHSEKGKHYAHTIDAEDPAQAARSVLEWIDAQAPGPG